MDPNTALANLRAAVQSALSTMASDTADPSYCEVSNDKVSDIIDAFEALDDWLSRGGFPPAAWGRNI